jgi:hypothetical protein
MENGVSFGMLKASLLLGKRLGAIPLSSSDFFTKFGDYGGESLGPKLYQDASNFMSSIVFTAYTGRERILDRSLWEIFVFSGWSDFELMKPREVPTEIWQHT